MKYLVIGIAIVLLTVVGCASPEAGPGEQVYDDGVYRGVFLDGGEFQVNVQFTLEDNVVTEARFRHLQYRDTDYLDSDDDVVVGLREQHEALLEHLIGTDIRDSLEDLYTPDFVEDFDGYSGATLRGNKVISAIRDALNRGVYVRP